MDGPRPSSLRPVPISAAAPAAAGAQAPPAPDRAGPASPAAAGGPPSRRPLPPLREWRPAWSAPAFQRAVRATVVIAGLFALTDLVIEDLQMAVFTAFGGFATLVLSSFGGSRRNRLVAHLLLALAGSALLCIGTLVSHSTPLAALVTVPVGFLVLFAGVCGPNAASGSLGALLVYVLPAASAGTVSMIPDRLAGWWLVSAVGTAAVLAMPAPAGDGGIREAASRLAARIAQELDAALAGRGRPGLQECVPIEQELQARFGASPYRPVGLAAPDQALGALVELLVWCTALLRDAVAEHPDLSAAAPADRELLAGAAEALDQTARLLRGEGARPALAELAALREQSLRAAARAAPGSPGFDRDARISFHAQAIGVAVLAVGAEALVAQRVADPEWLEAEQRSFVRRGAARASHRLSGLAAAAARNASVRSVWFVNSLRGAAALGAAVAIADLSSVQHGFWVVLGTISVLRSNAASTGATALQALSGTVLGFVIGSVLLLAIGTDTSILWAVLPVALFVAAYAPGTAPFPIGQAAFTVTVAVLFNLLAPAGWTVGLLRVEDVAIGCAVSVAFGALFWPRGIAGVVGDDLADAFRAGASFLAQAVGWTTGRRDGQPDGEPGALDASLRLDDALRGFVAERGSKRLSKQDLWSLVGGSMRLRLTAHSVASLPRDPPALASAREALERRMGKLGDWYAALADLLGPPRGRPVPELPPLSFGPEETVTESSGSHYAVWLCEHLDHLAEHLEELAPPATAIAVLRREPWWR